MYLIRNNFHSLFLASFYPNNIANEYLMKNLKHLITSLLTLIFIIGTPLLLHAFSIPTAEKVEQNIEINSVQNISNGTHFFKGTWEAALKKAKAEKKLIFVDLYFTGCAPCIQMDSLVFPQKAIATELNNNFVSFKSDIFKEEIGKKLSMKYAVVGFPTFLFLTPEGYVLDITSGFHEIDELLAILSTVKKNASEKKHKKFSPSLNLDYPKFYRTAYMEGKRKIPFEIVDVYLKQQKYLGNEIPYVIILGLSVGGDYSKYILENAKQLAKNYSRSQVKNALIKIVERSAKSLAKKGDDISYGILLEKIKPIFTEKEWLHYHKIFQNNYTKLKV